MSAHCWRPLTSCWVLLIVMGCGSGAKTGTVTGVVTFEGAPVKAGTIAFVAADGIPHHADIQADGTYRVENVPVGEAIVVVNAPPVDDPNKHMRIKEQKEAPTTQLPPPPFPARYFDMATSDLRCPVKSGENVYKAEMKR